MLAGGVGPIVCVNDWVLFLGMGSGEHPSGFGGRDASGEGASGVAMGTRVNMNALLERILDSHLWVQVNFL